MTNIEKINTETTFKVRNAVLRPNQPVESCYFDGDNLFTTSHYGYYMKGNLVGIISAFEKINENWSNDRQIQVRGMAVLDDFQKKGIGKQLLQHLIKVAKENNSTLIWCNARKNAVLFYEKNGFDVMGAAFEIEGIGTHYLMCSSI
jgi:GNAT superfamily N-acetyltransferase